MLDKTKVGDKVPDFSLQVGEKKFIHPRDFQGKKFILYFYPKDDTPGCTVEAKDFAANYSKFKKFDVEVIGVSKDNLQSHSNFAKKYCLPFILAVDHDGKACEAFGVWAEKSMYGKKYMGIERSTFLIDEKGIIKKAWRKVSVTGHIEEILKEVN
jgi:peroxiredoxin